MKNFKLVLLIQQSKIVTNAFKENKIRNKGIDIFGAPRKSDSCCYCCYCKSENISVKFLESILLLLRHSGLLGAKKGKGGGYYLIKDPKEINMAHVYRILEGPIALLPCASHNFYEKCADCTNETSCAVRRLMTEVRDNTLIILENNSLADIAF